MAEQIKDRDLRQTDARQTTEVKRPAASRPVRDDDRRKKRSPFLWLLPLLAVIALAAVLIPLLTGGDDENTAGNGGQAANGAAGGAAGGGAGTLTAGGVNVMGDSGSLGQHLRERATGRDLRVLSVIPNGGFFVGTSDADRKYIEYGGKYGPDEKTGLPEVGDRVNMVGKVNPAPADPVETLEVGPEDAALIKQQGAFINADRVTPAD